MGRLIQADPVLARKHVIPTSIPGIGSTTAVTVLAQLSELGTLESRGVASLAGVAPVTRKSGAWAWEEKGFLQKHSLVNYNIRYNPQMATHIPCVESRRGGGLFRTRIFNFGRGGTTCHNINTKHFL